MKLLIQKKLISIGSSKLIVLPSEIIQINGIYGDGRCELIVNDDNTILIRRIK